MKNWYNNLPEKLQKIIKGAGIAFLGLLATFMQEQIPTIDFGSFAVYMVAINSILVNTIRLFIAYLVEKS